MARRLGVYLHGDKATLYTDYGAHKILPEADPKATLALAKPSIPPSVGHHRELLDAIKSRQQPICSLG